MIRTDVRQAPTKPTVEDGTVLTEANLMWARRGLQVSVFSLGCGESLVGKFTVGTVCQLLALILLIPCLRLLSGRDVAALMSVVVGIFAGCAVLIIMTDQSPQWLQIPFFIVCAIVLTIVVRLAPHFDIREILRAPINLTAVILVVTAAYEKVTTHTAITAAYFDDKSHTAIAAVCLAILVLWVEDTSVGLLLSVLVFAVALATASRLDVAGAPFYAIALVSAYRRTRRRAQSAFSVYILHLAALAVAAMIWIIWHSSLSSYLQARLSSQTRAGATAQHSTDGHVQLALLALRLKSVNPFVSIFGVGPGGFPAGVRGFHLDASGLARGDYRSYLGIMDQTHFVPVHSVPLTILVEYPVWVSFAFFALWFVALRRLLAKRDITLLCMGLALFVMSIGYSAHDEYFYWAAFNVLVLGAFGRARNRQGPETSFHRAHESPTTRIRSGTR